MIVLPSAVIETFTGSSDLPLFAPLEVERVIANHGLRQGLRWRRRSERNRLWDVQFHLRISPSQASMRIMYAPSPGSLAAAPAVNAATRIPESAARRIMLDSPPLGRLSQQRRCETSRRARQPAVDVKRLPGDEGGVLAGEKRHRADQIGDLLAALDRLHVGHHLEQRPVGHFAGHLFARQRAGRPRQPRRDRVDGDALLAEFGGERAGESDHARLAGDVVDEVRAPGD